MLPYQKAFIECCLSRDILKFGEFTLKSGRVSPYFFNAGLFNDGEVLQEIGEYYAQTIIEQVPSFDLLFGPAYKGIPLVCTTAMQIASKTGKKAPFAFNRKTPKDHGEGGNMVGTPLAGDVLVVDDVITAGTAFREAKAMIEAAGARVSGLVVALDRQERGQDKRSAITQITEETGVPVYSIVNLDDILHFVAEKTGAHSAETFAAIRAYKDEYGA